MPSDYYPPREHFTDENHWRAHVETLKQVYAVRDLVMKHAEDIQSATSKIRRIEGQPSPGGPGNTVIGGVALKAAVPADGQTLKFVKQSGQIEWS